VQLLEFSLNLTAETNCKLFVKIEKVQLLESGTDIAEIADWSFED